MFALEINFEDGISQSEVVLVRRPQVLIGADENAHVVIDDLAVIGYQIQLNKDLGRKFKVKPIGSKESTQLSRQLEGVYEGQALLKAGTINLRAHSLDGDLALRESEAPDRAGVRILRQACALTVPTFPAIVIRGAEPFIVSFSPDQVLYLGRANTCLVRFESTDVSNKHARIGFESGNFWIEDLGSTNGTYVEGQQISGREEVAPGTVVTLGRNISLVGVTTQSELNLATSMKSQAIKRPAVQRYPVLVSTSEVARPARLVLQPGETLSIGRDPGSDLWLGAPHVSRKHCDVTLSKSGHVTITDHSTNGLKLGSGSMLNEENKEIHNQPEVLDFGSDITVALCFDEDQERRFTSANGASDIFSDRSSQLISANRTEELQEDIEEQEFEEQSENVKSKNTVAFGQLIKNLSLPAKAVLALGMACLLFLVWAVFSLVLKMV